MSNAWGRTAAQAKANHCTASRAVTGSCCVECRGANCCSGQGEPLHAGGWLPPHHAASVSVRRPSVRSPVRCSCRLCCCTPPCRVARAAWCPQQATLCRVRLLHRAATSPTPALQWKASPCNQQAAQWHACPRLRHAYRLNATFCSLQATQHQPPGQQPLQRKATTSQPAGSALRRHFPADKDAHACLGLLMIGQPACEWRAHSSRQRMAVGGVTLADNKHSSQGHPPRANRQ